MPNQRISELTAVTSPVSGDVLPIVNAGSTKKIAVGNLVGVRKDLSSNNLFSIEGDKNFSCNNVFIGKGLASSFNTSSFNNENVQNTVISNFSLSGVNRANRNILIGNYLMRDACRCINQGNPANLATFSNNIAIGNCSLQQPLNRYSIAYDACGNTTGGFDSNANIVIGNFSLNGKKLGNNVAIGNNSGPNLGGSCSGPGDPFTFSYSDTRNVLIGNCTGTNLCGNSVPGSGKTSCLNVFIGHGAGSQNVFGNSNIAIGAYSMPRDIVFNSRGNCCSTNNVMVGTCTGAMMLSGSSNNLFLGHRAGSFMAFNCDGYGVNSAGFSVLASRNIALGSQAMGYARGLSGRPTIQDNIAIGYKSLMRNCGYRNISIGSFSNFSRPFYNFSTARMTRFCNTISLGFSAQPTDNCQFVLGSAVAPLSTSSAAGTSQGRFMVINLNGQLGRIKLYN